MRNRFILIHGLPGAGKTTLCNRLAPTIGAVYANIGGAPDFTKSPMADICTRLYVKSGGRGNLLTEACLPARAGRDQFVSRSLELLAERGFDFHVPLVLYIEEPNEVLATRRKRSADDYEALRSKLQTGSSKFEYRVYRGHGEGVEARIAAVRELIEAIPPV